MSLDSNAMKSSRQRVTTNTTAHLSTPVALIPGGTGYSPVSNTAANLATANVVYPLGQLILAIDTGLYKIGDGVTAYNSLGYVRINQDSVYASSTTQQTNISAFVDVTALVTFTVVSGQPWFVHAYHPYVQCISTGPIDVMAAIADEANTNTKQAYLPSLALNKFTSITVFERITTPGTYQRKLRVGRFVGTGTITSLANDTKYEAFIRAYPER